MKNDFEVRRSTVVQAPPERVHALIDDFHAWTRWSPWEGLDPDLSRTYSGPSSGVGSRYAWRGNRKAGEGSMEITASTPERIGIALAFVKPMRSTPDVGFLLEPEGSGTRVTWLMRGETEGAAALFSRVVSMDKLLGKDLERGLARLKAVAEDG
jgi:hypothetical protein